MKTVKIVAGGYGYRANEKSPTRLILAGDFVCLNDAEAERLVKQGVAVCVEQEDKTQEQTESAATAEKPVRKRSRKTANE